MMTWPGFDQVASYFRPYRQISMLARPPAV